MTESKKEMSQPTLPLSKIFIPDNLRTKGWKKNLSGLVKLIKESGLKQPPGVVPYPENKSGPNGETHILVFGFRRLEALKQLNWTVVPVTLLPATHSNEKDIFVARIVENFGREDLSPLEEAAAYKSAIDDFNFTAKEIALRVGKTGGYVSQRLNLLKMPDYIQDAVQKGEITQTHVRELSRITDKGEQKRLLEKAKHTKLTAFKEDITSAESVKRTARGRPESFPGHEKHEASTATAQPKNPQGIPIPKIPQNDGRRSMSEEKEALSILDGYAQKAKELKVRSQQEFFRGMSRGIGWTCGLVSELIAPERKAEIKQK